jgi:hypothetical protein
MGRKSTLKGQRSRTCDIVGCEEKGRVLARMGTIEICYCPKHRKKYGERIINALVDSIFNYRLSNFLTEIKQKIFWSDDILSEDSARKLKEYILSKTAELEELEKYAAENEVNPDGEQL